MTYQFMIFLLFVVLSILFLFYCSFMEIIAETHHRQLKMKDLLYGPGIYSKGFNINYFKSEEK